MPHNPHREEIIRRLDLVTEFQKYGGRVPPGAKPSADGWLPVHSIDREDEHPSAALNVGSDPAQRGIYVDHAPTGSGAKSFFDLIAQLPASPWMTGGEVYRHYEKLTGLNGERDDKPERPAPTLADVEGFQKDLTPEVSQYLHEKRGVTDDTIAKHRLGWCLKRERNTIPVFDENGNLVNIRFHNSKKKPKTLNWTGYGQARLWGLERLVKAAPGITVVIPEGEFDAMLGQQETGFLMVSSTNGAKGFKPEWVKYFHGFHVVLLYDSDPEGREAVQALVLPAFKQAALSGQILSIKVIWLYEKQDKEHKDLTDWIVKDGGSGAQLKELIRQAAAHTFPTPTSHLEAPIVLQSFEQIDQAKYAGKRVTVPLQVFGENTVAYHAVKKFTVTDCPVRRDSKCTGRKELPGACMEEVIVPLGERVLIAGVRATDSQLLRHLRSYVCDKDKGPAITIRDEDRLTIREVFAHQVEGAMAAERLELVDKPIYIIGGALVEIGKYQVVGRVVTSYRDQQPTLLVDTLERQREDYQGFDLEEARSRLQKLKGMDVDEIADTLAHNVTRIFKRRDLHLAAILLLVSPLWMVFPGEGRIRAWLSCIVVGDTGTGKTTVFQKIFEFAGVGDRISGLTSSRTGLTYGIDWDERRGYRVKAGSFLKMTRQALIIDEAQDFPPEELKTVAEGLDTGLLKIDRIQHKTFESCTRTVFLCNPRAIKTASGQANQRMMSDFENGCQALIDIFPPMLIRRVDFALCPSSADLEDDLDVIFNPPEDSELPQVTAEDLRALIYWAWNLKPEQIVISPDVARRIREDALVISREFGCGEPPIVYPEDFRKTLARLSLAYAILDLSADDDFNRIIVRPGHVLEARTFVERIYRDENCQLHKQALEYRKRHGLQDELELQEKIRNLLEKRDESSDRFVFILAQLRTGERVRQDDLAKLLDCSRATINRTMRFFADHRLMQTNRYGCKKTPKLEKFLSRLETNDSELFTRLEHEIERVMDQIANEN